MRQDAPPKVSQRRWLKLCIKKGRGRGLIHPHWSYKSWLQKYLKTSDDRMLQQVTPPKQEKAHFISQESNQFVTELNTETGTHESLQNTKQAKCRKKVKMKASKTENMESKPLCTKEANVDKNKHLSVATRNRTESRNWCFESAAHDQNGCSRNYQSKIVE